MTEHFRSPNDIEREIEEDRARLTDNLSHLQDQFSVESFMNTASDQLRTHGGDIGQALSRTVKENPAAIALTGIGLAWMIFGKGRQPNDDARFEAYRDPNAYRRTGTPVSRPTPEMVGDNIPAPAWASDDNEQSGDSYADIAKEKYANAKDSVTEFGQSVSRSASNAQDAARDHAARAKSTVGSYANGASDFLGDHADHASGTAQDAKARAGAATERLKRKLSEGTENMSAEARARIIEARYAALAARNKAAAHMQRTSDGAADMYERQPLVAGALALAVGAAIASALPRTKIEDENVGAKSDALMERAERIFAEERAKALEVAEAAKSEAVKSAKSVKADLKADASVEIDKVAEHAKSAAQNIKDAATSKAKSTGLGDTVK